MEELQIPGSTCIPIFVTITNGGFFPIKNVSKLLAEYQTTCLGQWITFSQTGNTPAGLLVVLSDTVQHIKKKILKNKNEECIF